VIDLTGAPKGTRTPVFAVKGRLLLRWMDSVAH
jgi:hypothetical protein